MDMHRTQPDCFPNRIARAGQHLDRGEWASGHAIASALLKCASNGGCSVRGDCACAASRMLGHVRQLLA